MNDGPHIRYSTVVLVSLIKRTSKSYSLMQCKVLLKGKELNLYIKLLVEASSNRITVTALLSAPITIDVSKCVKKINNLPEGLHRVSRYGQQGLCVALTSTLRYCVTHPQFADDIVLIAETTNQSQVILTELNN